MAGVPCVNDTCSVVATVDANGRLDLNARLRTDGGLNCVDGQGLGILLDPNAGNTASLSAAGLLVNGAPHQLSLGNGGTPQTWTDGGASGSIVTTVTNIDPLNSLLAIVHVKWIFNFTVAAELWEIEGTFNTDSSISTNVEETFVIGGADNNALTDNKSHQGHATFYRTIPGASSLTLTSYGNAKVSQSDGSISGGTFVAFHDIALIKSPAAVLANVT